jgi:hypothetical protein
MNSHISEMKFADRAIIWIEWNLSDDIAFREIFKILCGIDYFVGKSSLKKVAFFIIA